MSGRRIKLIISSLIFLLISNSLFAVEEYVSKIYKELDQIFIIKSEKDLNTVLSTNNEDKYYYLIENYTEKKIRRLIVNNDYDFAMTAIVIVIENNLDNEQAVEMYSVIADAYEVQQNYLAAQEQKRQLEIARVEMEKEKQRGTAEKEFVSAKNVNTGKAVYVSGKETKLTSSAWKANMGLVNLTDLYDAVSDFNSIHYGVSLDYRYEYTLENKMVIGTDIFGGFQFLTIADAEHLIPVLADGEVLGKFATPAVSKNLFYRLGFGALFTGKTEALAGTAQTAGTMLTPIVGLKMENLELGTVKLDLGADWYAGHLFYEDITFAGGVNANLAFPFAEMEKIKLNLNIGVKDKFLLKGSGIENRASVILAVGAENVIR